MLYGVLRRRELQQTLGFTAGIVGASVMSSDEYHGTIFIV